MTIPSITQFNELFPNEQSANQYLQDRNVFYTTYKCAGCGEEMKRNPTSDDFRCYRRSCSKRGNRISGRRGTFFYASSISTVDILRLAQLWLAKVPAVSCINLTGQSSHTICHYYQHFRQLVSSALKEEDQVIGGPGVVVEIDETKLGKRKYNRGHRVDGVWVVVGIERKENGKIFLVPVQDRSALTLRQIISDHVYPNTIVHTDMWRGYQNLEDFGLTHLTVNHSKTFKDPVSMACTNTVEGLNSGLKRRIPIRNRIEEGIEFHLGEYVWRRQNATRLFDAFCDALRDIHYELE